jgi:formate C-acetyltransferase
MKFHRPPRGEDGLNKLVGVMKTYFEQGGMELRSTSSPATHCATRRPTPRTTRTRDRVAGFSAYFVEVFKESQDDLIRRTEMVL